MADHGVQHRSQGSSNQQLLHDSCTLSAGDLTLYPEQHRVTLNGDDVGLTPTEFKLLHTLMSAPGRVLTREYLLARLHADGSVVIDRVVDVHVGRLRQKVEKDPTQPRYIETIRGSGYRFTREGAAEVTR